MSHRGNNLNVISNIFFYILHRNMYVLRVLTEIGNSSEYQQFMTHAIKPYSCHLPTTEALIRQCTCASWSGTLLFAYNKSRFCHTLVPIIPSVISVFVLKLLLHLRNLQLCLRSESSDQYRMATQLSGFPPH